MVVPEKKKIEDKVVPEVTKRDKKVVANTDGKDVENFKCLACTKRYAWEHRYQRTVQCYDKNGREIG